MTESATFEQLLGQLENGERLAPSDIEALATAPDILTVGMLADTLRRRLHGTRVTYVRVATCAPTASFADAVPPAAGEVRIAGTPDGLDAALAAVESAKAVAGERIVSGFSWPELEAIITAAGVPPARALTDLRARGLDAIAELPLDRLGDPASVIDLLAAGGYQVRLTIAEAPPAARTPLLLLARQLRQQFACIRAINPLPTVVKALRPTTGYEDVRMVAIARLAGPEIQTVQVDWHVYGPKLAQVALTFGADDLDGVSPFDEAPQGRRRAPIEEVRRNIEAAGFTPAERDGRFGVVA